MQVIDSEMAFQNALIESFLSKDFYAEKVKSAGRNGRPDINVRHFPIGFDIEAKWIEYKDIRKPFKSFFQPGQLTTYIDWISKGSGEIYLAIAVNWGDDSVNVNGYVAQGVTYYTSMFQNQDQILSIIATPFIDLIPNIGFDTVDKLTNIFIDYSLVIAKSIFIPSQDTMKVGLN